MSHTSRNIKKPSLDRFDRFLFILLIGTVAFSSAHAQTNQEGEQSDPVGSEQTTTPPPRVVGRAGTQEELEAWQTVNQATELGEKAELAARFLDTYPDSGLTPFAHQILAQNAYQSNDIEQFISHAEKALEEIPQNPDLLTPLAFVHAERGESQEAIKRAEEALEALDRIEKPLNVPTRPWVEQVFQMRADALYSLGRAYLGQMKDSESAQERARDPNLQQAIQYLTEALTYDPRHDYAQFRLGYAHTTANQAEPAMEAYARAAAIGGAAADPAREQLTAIHDFVRENIPESDYADLTIDEILQQQGELLNRETEDRNQQVAELVARIEQQEAQQKQEQQQQGESQQPQQPAQNRPSLRNPGEQ